MAADPLVGDIFQYLIVYRANGQILNNVLYYKLIGLNVTEPTYEAYLDGLNADIASDITTGILEPMLELLGSDVGLLYTQAQKVYPTREYYKRYTQTGAGANPMVCSIQNVALSITKRGEKAGRGKSGHFQVGGLANGTFAGGKHTPATLVLAEAVAASLRSRQYQVGGVGIMEPGMFSKGLGAGNNWNKMIATTVQPEVRTMHRRTLGLGI